MSALDPADAAKFGKLIALFGSSHQGEQLAALNRASAFLSARSMGWTDIGEALKHPPVIYRPSSSASSHQQDALRCLGSVIAWKPHEREFLVQMSSQRRHPTKKQESWLDSLVDRVLRHEQRRAA